MGKEGVIEIGKIIVEIEGWKIKRKRIRRIKLGIEGIRCKIVWMRLWIGGGKNGDIGG